MVSNFLGSAAMLMAKWKKTIVKCEKEYIRAKKKCLALFFQKILHGFKERSEFNVDFESKFAKKNYPKKWKAFEYSCVK